MTGPPPLIRATVDRQLAERLRAEGWRLHQGFRPAGPWALDGVLCWGPVHDPEALADALEAAARGAGLVLTSVAAEHEATLLDDCRRLGLVVRDVAPPERRPDDPPWAPLLDLLVAGMPVDEAARRCFLSERSAYRRLGQARRELGAASTTAAVVAWRRRREQQP